MEQSVVGVLDWLDYWYFNVFQASRGNDEYHLRPQQSERGEKVNERR